MTANERPPQLEANGEAEKFWIDCRQKKHRKSSLVPNIFLRKALQKKLFLPQNFCHRQNDLEQNLKHYWKRKEIFRNILKVYTKSINSADQSGFSLLKASSLANGSFENCMRSVLNKTDDRVLNPKEKEYFVASRIAYNKINVKKQMNAITKTILDDSEIKNNVLKINKLVNLVFKTEKKIKSFSEANSNGVSLIEMETNTKLRNSQIQELSKSCQHLLNILLINNRQNLISDLLDQINHEFHKSLQLAIQQLKGVEERTTKKHHSQGDKFSPPTHVAASNSSPKDAQKTPKISSKKVFGNQDAETVASRPRTSADLLNSEPLTNSHEDFDIPKITTLRNRQNNKNTQNKPNQHENLKNKSENGNKNGFCLALCDFEGDELFLSMKEGEKIAVVRRDSIGQLYGLDSDGREKRINTHLVNYSTV